MFLIHRISRKRNQPFPKSPLFGFTRLEKKMRKVQFIDVVTVAHALRLTCIPCVCTSDCCAPWVGSMCKVYEAVPEFAKMLQIAN